MRLKGKTALIVRKPHHQKKQLRVHSHGRVA
jgi:hypothetical protein